MILSIMILEYLKLFGINKTVVTSLAESIENWTVELTSKGETLVRFSIKRGIFHGNSLSQYLCHKTTLSNLQKKAKDNNSETQGNTIKIRS